MQPISVIGTDELEELRAVAESAEREVEMLTDDRQDIEEELAASAVEVTALKKSIFGGNGLERRLKLAEAVCTKVLASRTDGANMSTIDASLAPLAELLTGWEDEIVRQMVASA